MTATRFDDPPEESVRAGWVMPHSTFKLAGTSTSTHLLTVSGQSITNGFERSGSETYLTEDSLARQ